MIKECNSPIYGVYFVDYCVRFNVEILRQVGVNKYIKADDAFRKVFCGLYTISLIKEETNFDFLMGWPFKDINQNYQYPEKKWKKLPIAINRDKVNKLLDKYPEFRYDE